MLTALEDAALLLRRRYVEEEGLLSIEGLAAIVAPSHDLREASLAAARAALEEERAWRPPPKPAPRKRYVTLAELAASL